MQYQKIVRKVLFERCRWLASVLPLRPGLFEAGLWKKVSCVPELKSVSSVLDYICDCAGLLLGKNPTFHVQKESQESRFQRERMAQRLTEAQRKLPLEKKKYMKFKQNYVDEINQQWMDKIENITCCTVR
jgi:hypothetical protein